MMGSAFLELEFFALVIFSLILPIGIYFYLLTRNKISRHRVTWFGFLMIAMSGVDLYLLQRLREIARVSGSQVDDRVFASEVSIALYLLPAIFAGIGVNVVSHILIDHLKKAEDKFTEDEPS